MPHSFDVVILIVVQAFLNLCTGNHYQFDSLRRAKYSSMMVLWHMFNPDAPAFVHSCNNCAESIEVGLRWNCSLCDDFDLCDKCNKTTSHVHRLAPCPVTMTIKDDEQKILDEVGLMQKMCSTSRIVVRDISRFFLQHKRQQQAHAVHLQLLVHCASCISCTMPHCVKMKLLMSVSAHAILK
jgi:hypothetical protein